MRHYVCSVFDRKAQAFLPITLAATKGVAVRGFLDACNQKDHPFMRHAEDYRLACLGEWEDSDGNYMQYPEPETLFEARDAERQE